MDCRISGSFRCKKKKKTSWHPFSCQTVLPLNTFPVLTFALIWLLQPLCQLSVHRWFKPLPLMAVTSVYLFMPVAGMQDQRKCLTCFLICFFLSMGTDFLFGEKLSSNCRAEAESLVATAAVLILSSFAHHLLQSWQNVQTCLIMPGSIKKSLLMAVH